DPAPAAAGDAPPRDAQPLPPLPGEEGSGPAPSGQPAGHEPATGPEPSTALEPGEAAEYGTERHRKMVGLVWQHLGRLGYPGEKKETDEDKARRLAGVAKLAGVAEIGSTSDLDLGELSAVIDTLARCKNAEALDKLLKAGEISDEH
ncbi:MAG TPA: hypothetical protein VFQ68_09835, partial [Streptosporangiaceae bacterium]|nr:hypothetical protein [Streptosporangiaceae bacterium]